MKRRRFQKKKVTKVTQPSSNGEEVCIYCIFCYKLTCKEDTEDSRISKPNKLNICQRFYKHIDVGEVPSTEEIYGTTCGVCDSCFYMIDNHCQLYYEIECLRLKMKWQIHKLCRVMKYAGKATSRVKDFEKGFMSGVAVTKGSCNLERVLSFRKKLYNKCSQGLKKKNPQVVLSNKLVAKSKDENISLSKEAKVVSRESKLSKGTQTSSELTEFTQDSSEHDEHTEVRTDHGHDENVASNNGKIFDKFSHKETQNAEQIINKNLQSSSSSHDNFKGVEYGMGEVHSTNLNFKCIICNCIFLSNTALVEHERDKHWDLITGNKSKESLNEIIAIATVDNNLDERKCQGNKSVCRCCDTVAATDQTFACAVCGILYSSLNSLNAHLITAHNMLITPVNNQINHHHTVDENESSANYTKSQDDGFNKVPEEDAGVGEDAVTVRKTPRRAKRFQAECPKCGKIFKCVDKWRAKEKVKRHLRTKMHGGNGIWKVCDNCGRRFKTKHLLKMHRRSPCETTVNDGDGDPISGPGNLLVLREIFKCCHCVKTFSTQEKLASHEGARECFDDNDEANDDSEGSDYNRDWSTRKPAKLVKPIFTATCPKCWKVFERRNEKDLQAALNRHLYESKLHGGKHSWKHLCSWCGIRYQNKSRLEAHMHRNHNEESSKSNAGNGVNEKHTSDIDYFINSESLEGSTWNMSNPISESKLGDKMLEDFKCAFCDFQTNAYDLMEHENTYHSYFVSDEKLKCSRCPQIFDMEMPQNYSSLKAHFLHAHLSI